MIYIKERIKALRKALDLTQEEFAVRLNLSANYIYFLEKGEREPSPRTITDICRIYGVSRIWLETGEGEMFAPINEKEQILDYLGNLMNGSTMEADIQLKLISCLSKLGPDEWAVLYKLAKEWTQEEKKEEGQA